MPLQFSTPDQSGPWTRAKNAAIRELKVLLDYNWKQFKLQVQHISIQENRAVMQVALTEPLHTVGRSAFSLSGHAEERTVDRYQVTIDERGKVLECVPQESH